MQPSIHSLALAGVLTTCLFAAPAFALPLISEVFYDGVGSDNGQSFVYIVKDDNTVARRNVRTGLITDDGVAIVEGLTGTEKVVLRAGGFLKPGEKVSPKVRREQD